MIYDRFYCCSSMRSLESPELDRIKTVVLNSTDTSDDIISDVFEKYHIYKYCSNNGSFEGFEIALIKTINNKASVYKSDFYIFINKLSDENIVSHFAELPFYYQSDFWQAFDKCKIYETISKQVFSKLLGAEICDVFNIMAFKNIIRAYDDEITTYIKNNNYTRELINIYRQNEKTHFLPKSLTKRDIEDIFLNYIMGEHINANILDDIIHMCPNGVFNISDEVKYKAQKRRDQFNQKLFESNTGMCLDIETEVVFEKMQEEPFICSGKPPNMRISYSGSWIDENLDYPTLLNNFIYLFGYADPKMKISLIYKPNTNNSTFDELLHQVKYSYTQSHCYPILQNIAHITTVAYYNRLKRNQVNLEDVIRWFYSDYIVKEFNCSLIQCELLNGGNHLAKCCKIATTIESILKQYNYFVENGNIDYNFIAFSQTPIKFESVKSLNENKYIIGDGDTYNRIVHLLFSNQSVITHSKTNKIAKNFAELIKENKLIFDDFYEYQHEELSFLLKEEIVELDNNIFVLKNSYYNILSELYYDEFISVYRANSKHCEIFELFEEKGWLKYISTLLAPQESAYFNYYLNDSQFSDGLKLRNKYLHGTQDVIEDDDIHRNNYFIFIRLLVLLTIKINDDLCIHDGKDNA